MEQKKRLRSLMRAEKAKYTANDLQALSTEVLDALESCPEFVQARTVLLYHSLPDEVYTHTLIERYASSKRIVLPRVMGDDLSLHLYTGKNDLQRGSYGIDEPVGEVFDSYDEIELAIIPGMAFDRQGNRLGRGKGYYDRLLPRLKAFKMGLCFPFQYVDNVPTEATDMAMDKVVSGQD
ncbi:MAG: 5-formyltetrahydrofolate cyclo-ligase [Bacteroides sp.]|nr:5-formyltetrahydrofolate cyclo-ligase [Bacteroides sp.]